MKMGFMPWFPKGCENEFWEKLKWLKMRKMVLKVLKKV
jgi:hypothetical protein